MQNNLHYHQLYMPYRAQCRGLQHLAQHGCCWFTLARQITLKLGGLIHLHRLEVRNLSQVTIMCRLHLNGIGWPRLTQISLNFELKKHDSDLYKNDFSLEKWFKFARFRIKKVPNRQSFMITSRRYPRIYEIGFLFLFLFFFQPSYLINVAKFG